MNELAEIKETMTLLEMAELLGARHTDVRRGVKRLAEELGWEMVSEDVLKICSGKSIYNCGKASSNARQRPANI